MPFGFWFLSITLPSFWGTLATWILISRHHFAFFFSHLECDSWLVKFWFGLVLLVCFEHTDIWYKLLELIWKLLTLRFHTPSGNPLEKKVFFLTGQSIAMIQWQEKWPKNIRSLLTLDRKMDWSFPYVQDFVLYLFKNSCLEEITSPIPLYQKHHYKQS